MLHSAPPPLPKLSSLAFAELQGKLADASDVLEPLKAKRDFTLAAMHALACFHKRSPRPDMSEIESLDIAAEMAVETASDVALLHAAYVLLHCQMPQVCNLVRAHVCDCKAIFWRTGRIVRPQKEEKGTTKHCTSKNLMRVSITFIAQ